MFLNLYYKYDVICELWNYCDPWFIYKPMFIVSEMRYNHPQNFDLGHSIHKTRRGAVLALETLHRWKGIPRRKLYIQEC